MKKKNTNPICHGKSPRLGTIGNHQIKAGVWAVLFLTKSDAFLKNCIIQRISLLSSMYILLHITSIEILLRIQRLAVQISAKHL